MFCPKKFNSRTLDGDGNCKAGSCQCEKEKCGWWDTYAKSCGPLADNPIFEDSEEEL